MAETQLNVFGGYRAGQERIANERAATAAAVRRQLRHQELSRDRTLGEVAVDTAIGGLQGAVEVGKAAYGVGNVLSLGTLEWATGLSDNFGETQRILDSAKSNQLQYQSMQNQRTFEEDGILAGVGDFITNPALLGDLAVTQGMSVLPTAATARLAASATMNRLAPRGLSEKVIGEAARKNATKAAVLTGGAQMGGSAYVEAFNQAIEEGLTEGEANARALAAGVITAGAGMAISKLPGVGAAGAEGAAASRLAGVPDAAARYGRQVGDAFRREATEEYLQSGMETAVQNIVSERKALMDGVAKSAAMGAVGGGLLGAGMGIQPATAQFRADLKQVMDQSAADSGFEDMAKSNLEKRGEDVLKAEAAAANQQRAAIEQLSASGFVANEDGTVSRPGDVLYGEGPFTVEQALEIAADEQIMMDEVPTEEPTSRIPSPEVGEIPADGAPADLPLVEVDEVGLPLPQVEEEATGYRAFRKATDLMRQAGAEYRVVDGRAVFVTEAVENDVPTVAEMDDVSGIEVARSLGAISDNEAAEATRYIQLLNDRRSDPNAAPPAPRSQTPVTEPLSASEVQAQEEYTAQEVALREAEFYADEDGTYYTVDADGNDAQLTRGEALQRIGYVPAGQDLLADPISTPVQLEAAELVTGRGEFVPEQYMLKGIDPLFEAVDEANRRDAAIARLQELAQTPTLLPAPEGQDIRDGWSTVFDGAVEAHNNAVPAADRVTFNKAMRNSKLLRDFVEGAVEAGLQPGSAASFDYVAEQARAAEVSDAKAAQVLAIVADMSGAVAPGTASLQRWRQALARKKIAAPGQMKGPAYAAFKSAVEKATITPGSVEFDTFMQNFSATLTEEQAGTPFGQRVRDAYPYAPPAVAEARAKEAKAKQVIPTRKKLPPIGAGVAPLVKSAREKALTEPSPEPLTEEARAAEPAVKKQKRAVRQQLQQNVEEVGPDAINRTERQIQRQRNEALVEEDDSGVVDPDVAAVDRDAARAAARAQAGDAAVEAINATVYEVQQRVARLSVLFGEAVGQLKQTYANAGTKGDTTQGRAAFSDVVKNRLAAVDRALTKDAGDIATWGGIVGTVVQSNEAVAYADNNAAYDQFLVPAMERFVSIVSEAQTADGVRIYREVLRDVGVEQFIDQRLTGKTKAKAKQQLAQLNQYMDGMIDRMTGDPANPNNMHPFKVNKAKYSMAAAAVDADARLPRNELDDIVNEWDRNRPTESTPFTVYDTVAEAQAALGIAIPAAANGIYYNRGTYVIAENITSAQEAREVMLHERTHGGLEALLGPERLNAVMNRVWANGQLRRRTKTKMKRHQINRVQAAEEVIVDMVVSGERLNKGLYSKIRAAITARAEALFGLTEYSAPDSMVDELLRDTGDYLRGAKHELNLRESYVNDIEAYKAVFEGRSVIRSPMFSIAGAELERWTSGETSDTAVFQEKFQKANAEALRDNWKGKAKDQALSLYGYVSRGVMAAMPGSQIADWNRGLFYDTERRTDILNQFVNDKLAKENDMNKVFQRKRKMYYNAPDGGQQEFNESPRDVARDWEQLTNRRANARQATAMNKVNQLGTMFKVHPDRAWDQQSGLDYKAENFTEADRRNAYREVRAEWDAMTSDTKQLYRRVQAVYTDLWAERMNEVRAQAGRIAEASTTLPDLNNPEKRVPAKQWRADMESKISTSLGRIQQGPYSPLQRFGDYYVIIRDAEGKVVFSSGHDTEAQARDMERSMSKDLPEGYSAASAVRQAYLNNLDGISQQQYVAIQTALAGTFPQDNETDSYARKNAMAAMEEVMLQSLPDHSLLKHANARTGVAGATPDAFRAFNDYVVKSARNLSSMRYDHKIQGALGEMRKMAGNRDGSAINLRRGKVYEAILNQHAASQSSEVNMLSQVATSVAFGMYMTSPSQLFLGVSQTALVTIPVLAAEYGIGDTMRYMKEAFTEAVRAKGTGMHSDRGQLGENTVMHAVMQNLKEGGTLDFTQSHEMSDMAQRESDLAHSRWRTTMHYASSFMRLSEIFNRETAAYVVVRGEMRRAGVTDEQFQVMPDTRKQELLNEWGAKAEAAVRETQFLYNQSNKAPIMQGPIGRVVFQFQSFRVNMLALIARTVRDSVFGVQDPSMTVAERQNATKQARRTLAYMTVTQLLLTGASSSVIAPVLFALADMFRDDDELLNAEEAFLQATPQILSMGLLSQVLDPQRFGFNTLIPILGGSRYMPASDDPQDTFDHILLNSLGPTYGIGSQMLDGVDSLLDGEYGRAAGQMLPKPLSDLLKIAVTEQTEMSDRQGITWYERTPADMAWNVLGLRTGAQASAQADRAAIYAGTQRASDRRSKLLFKYVSATDGSERAAALQEVARWNQRYGGDSALVINNSTLKSAMKTRAEKELNARLYGVPSTRTPETVRRLTYD